MKPKEKAEELVDRFLNGARNKHQKMYHYVTAKKCALICVEEVLLTIIDIDDEGSFAFVWWNEVKQEIEKL